MKVVGCRAAMYPLQNLLHSAYSDTATAVWRHAVGGVSIRVVVRPQSRGLESLAAGLQSLRLASRLKPWLRTIDGLGWLMAARHGLQVQRRKLTPAN